MTDTSKEAVEGHVAFLMEGGIDIYLTRDLLGALSTELEATKAQLATARDVDEAQIIETVKAAIAHPDEAWPPIEAVVWQTLQAIKSSPARGDTQDEKRRKVIEVGTALLADVRARYPGERLKCQYMLDLAVALGELKGMAQGEKP